MKILLSSLSLLLCLQGYAASFDCENAISLSEVTICNDSELSKLDDELGVIYKKAKKSTKDIKKFKKQAVAILKWREANCFSKDCLLNWYKQRKISLEKVINNNPVTKTETKAKEQFNKSATVFDPVSNVRDKPKGEILCKVKTVKKINVKKHDNDWYLTDTCNELGYIHKSQIQFSTNKKKTIKQKPKKKVVTQARKKPTYRVGNRVCSTMTQGKNGWCGYITQMLGESARVENFSVFCKKGGFLGICTNISMGSCSGSDRLFTDDSGETYKNPNTLIVPTYCFE